MLESSFDHFGESAEKGIFDKSFTLLGFFTRDVVEGQSGGKTEKRGEGR